jgi:hypothetical protein
MVSTSSGKDAADFARGLDTETRRTITAAMDSMSQWRNEVTGANERFAGAAFEKMAAAARAVGWPDDLVKATQTQLEHSAKFQSHMIDQIMDAWKKQLSSPSTMANPAQLMEQMKHFGASFPGMETNGMAGGPMQIWMQAAEMWQKNWMTAMQTWMNAAGMGDQDKRR